MRTGFLITGRLKSKRLPRKLLRQVGEHSMISWMIKRLKTAPELDEIVIATSTNPEDDPLEEVAKEQGIRCFRGSEEHVTNRLLGATDEYKLDYVINMTADCPLLPVENIGTILDTYRRTGADLVSHYDLSPGLYLSGVNPQAWREINSRTDDECTEYWLYYFLKTSAFKVEKAPFDQGLVRPNYRFVLDYPEDLEFLRAVYTELGPQAHEVRIKDLMELVDQHPEWPKINWSCHKKMLTSTASDPNSRVSLDNQTMGDDVASDLSHAPRVSKPSN